VADDDLLTLTVRLHDAQEKRNPKLAASWVVRKIPRSDLQLSKADFAAKWLLPSLDELEHFKPR
jgi:hypothetical protein